MEKQNNKYGTFKYHFIQILKSFPRSKVVFSLIILIKFLLKTTKKGSFWHSLEKMCTNHRNNQFIEYS